MSVCLQLVRMGVVCAICMCAMQYSNQDPSTNYKFLCLCIEPCCVFAFALWTPVQMRTHHSSLLNWTYYDLEKKNLKQQDKCDLYYLCHGCSKWDVCSPKTLWTWPVLILQSLSLIYLLRHILCQITPSFLLQPPWLWSVSIIYTKNNCFGSKLSSAGTQAHQNVLLSTTWIQMNNEGTKLNNQIQTSDVALCQIKFSQKHIQL